MHELTIRGRLYLMGEVDAEHSSPTPEFAPEAQTGEEERETLQ
jgi:hypothetical protein